MAGWQWRTVIGLLAFCEFNPAQLENFTWAFQPVFFLAFLLALVSIGCLAIYAQRIETHSQQKQRALLWLCIGSAILAEFSIAAGVICWVILPFCIGLLKLKRTLLRPIFIAGAICIGVYLIGYHSPERHISPIEAIQRPFDVMAYVQTFLGASWDRLSRNFGMFLSPIAISFVAGIWIKAIWRRDIDNRLYAIALSMSVFCLLTALLTALGRLNFGLHQATESRYQTPAMLFWCFGTIALLTVQGVASQRRNRHFLAIQLAWLLLFVFQAKDYGAIVDAVDAATFSHNMSGLVIESGIDKEQARNVFTTLQPIEWYSAIRAKGYGPPFFPPYEHIGESVNRVYTVASPSQCAGYLESIETVDGNPSEIRARGWASVPSIWGRGSTIILAASDSKIVGVGVTGKARPDIVTAGLLPARESNGGWYGLAKVSPDEKTIQAYEELPGGKEVCLLNGRGVTGQ
jgi:hypothetical protein